MLRTRLNRKLESAVRSLQAEGLLPESELPAPELYESKSPEHGDYASNFAMVAAKSARKSPRELAEAMAKKLSSDPDFESVEVAGPGFLNLKVSRRALAESLEAMLSRGVGFALTQNDKPLKINVEFVSVNPNGPITVGSGRGAAFGDTLCRVLEAVGHQVHREYYVNDGVNSQQMRLFAESVRHYILAQQGKASDFPAEGYKGDYVQEVAARVQDQMLAAIDEYLAARAEVRKLVERKEGEPAWSSREEECLHRARDVEYAAREQVETYQKAGMLLDSVEEVRDKIANLFGDYLETAPIGLVQQVAQNLMLERQRNDLADFGVHFDTWFSEQTLHDEGIVTEMVEKLRARGIVEEEDGALWLRSTKFGDDKDRVIVRADGRPTYIAGDVAYHASKFTRPPGCDKLIDVLGPDHHGYVGRLEAVVQALGHSKDQIEVLIFQIVRFLKDGKPAPMRKRDGNIYALSDLCREVGSDVVRFFYLMRSHDTHFDFDVDLAKRQSEENPVYYVQYAHARICSVLRKAIAEGLLDPDGSAIGDLELLVEPQERALILKLGELPYEIIRCSKDYGVHRLTTYAIELARAYHHFYDSCRVLQADQPELTGARLALCQAVQNGLRATFELLGIGAPERMDRAETLGLSE